VAFTWGFEGSSFPAGSSTVEVDLVREGDATIVRVAHRGVPANWQPLQFEGWERYLERLSIVASGRDPGHDRWRPASPVPDAREEQEPPPAG
jgi:hypothetical protein